MPEKHANLSPSASERWIQCPASIRMEKLFPKSDSVYAQEGTIAHTLGEIEVSRAFGIIDDKQYLARFRAWQKDCKNAHLTDEQTEDMKAHIADYVHLVQTRAASEPNSQVLVEQRMSSGVPDCWGTSDIVIVSPRHVEIIDLKYGQGVAVSAKGNPQLRLYALGAYDTFGSLLGDPETVTMTVFQPRLDALSSETMATEDLLAWRESVIPIAESALGDDAPFGPSEEACRWCPASGMCKPQLEFFTRQDFTVETDVLEPHEIADVLKDLPGIRKWCDALEERALDLAYSQGVEIPGHKVVISGGQRTINDVEGAVADMEGLGFDKTRLFSEPKILGIGAFETLIKELPKVKDPDTNRLRFARLEDVIPERLGRTEGRPSLVHEDDPRDAVSSLSDARKDFA